METWRDLRVEKGREKEGMGERIRRVVGVWPEWRKRDEFCDANAVRINPA